MEPEILGDADHQPDVCSATVVSLTPGVKSTGSFLAVAYLTSIESRPMPYLAMTLSRGSAASMTLAVIWSSPLSRPSNPPLADELEHLLLGQRARGADDFEAAVVQHVMVLAGRVLETGRGKKNVAHVIVRVPGVTSPCSMTICANQETVVSPLSLTSWMIRSV